MSSSHHAVVAIAAALALAACGDDATRDAPSASTSQDPPPATTPDGIDVMAGASTEPVSEPAANTTTALLTDVRAARHEGFDRVVFEFRGDELPGYTVRYVGGPVRQDGSGEVVDVAGSHVVLIRMENALDADLSKESAPLTYTGPQRFTPGTPQVAELVRAGGFEGVLTWAVGLQDRVDFRVTTLEDPARLVVNFRNH